MTLTAWSPLVSVTVQESPYSTGDNTTDWLKGDCMETENGGEGAVIQYGSVGFH